MKKTIVTLAIAASMAAPAVVMADSTVYGNVHLSINAADNDVVGASNNIQMSSNTSAIGVKGSEDLGDGMKAIYKVEFGIDLLGKADSTPDSGTDKNGNATGAANTGSGTLGGRDQFVGLKGGMGTVKFGTMSSNYKQMGGKVDPMYRTRLEGRGFLKTQSSLHGGRGITSGRSTNTVQYSSPKMGGIQLVANTTVSGADEETSGLGLRYGTKAITAYFDFISNDDADAMKVGGKFSAKAFSAGLQYEMLDDGNDFETDIIFLSGTFKINKNNSVALTYGMADYDDGTGTADSTGLAVAYFHKLSKMTNVYVGYGDLSDDDAVVGGDDNVLTFGIKKKF